MENRDYSAARVVIVGAGPAGLAAAIGIRKADPTVDVLVLDKSAGPGGHILSGAVVEPGPLERLMTLADPGWRTDPRAGAVVGRRVQDEDTLFLLGTERAFSVKPLLSLARALGIGLGHMLHTGDYVLSAARLTSWLVERALEAGVEVLFGFGVDEVLFDAAGRAVGVRTVEQGLDRERRPLRNHQPAETIRADFVLLCEGSRGFVTERAIAAAGLVRAQPQLYSVGVKRVYEVSKAQYEDFGDTTVLHTVGYPLWTPVVGPGLLGGGFLYPMGEQRIAVGAILGLDWPYTDLVPQDVLVRLTEHARVRRYIEGARLVEGGARMIPEGGYASIPRDPETNAIGRKNLLILGDSAGLVDMHRIKGLHNAIRSGLAAGTAVVGHLARADEAAPAYTRALEADGTLGQLREARNFRQVIARFGNLLGFSVAPVAGLLPQLREGPDFETMTDASYPHRLERPFDKDAFVATAHVEHREDQPVHCEVVDERICDEQCAGRFGRPCVKFCLGGVYELHEGRMRPANPSNCVHCKTCECKCPYDNLRWHVPEGGGGPNYEGV